MLKIKKIWDMNQNVSCNCDQNINTLATQLLFIQMHSNHNSVFQNFKKEQDIKNS